MVGAYVVLFSCKQAVVSISLYSPHSTSLSQNVNQKRPLLLLVCVCGGTLENYAFSVRSGMGLMSSVITFCATLIVQLKMAEKKRWDKEFLSLSSGSG